VIILDEAQTMSRDLLAPTTDVLQSLVDHYGCTIVLCTATQPTLSRGVLQDCGFVKTEEVVEDPDGLAERLRRVEVDWSRAASPISWSALAEELAGESDALAIVHRRDDARELALAIDVFTGDASTIHLSALMCPAHRQAVLATIRSRKGRGEAVRVVSTQLVEAGVDLDFPVVYRALAGVDAMTQAAGRCNREGRLTRLGALRVFRAPTSPPKGILEQGLDVTTSMLAAGPLDLFAPGTHARYFSDLYGLHLHDTKEIQALRAELRFEDVARAYQMIQDEWSAPLTVPLDDRARTTIRDLERLGPSRDRLRAIARSTVNVRKNDLAGWLASGSVRSIADGLVNVLVDGGVYDPRFGLIPERVGTLSPTRSVV
jgi:CRISPR-associated endonuclease/helicase Cas3